MRPMHLAVVVAVSLGVVACSGDDKASVFTPAEAGPAVDPTPVTSFQDGGDDATTAACTPASVASFSPSPVGTKPLYEGVCTSAQLDAYYTACLTQPYSKTGCDAFKAANTACGACVDTADGDAQLGPVVWHDSRSWFTLNIAGCIATADKSHAACGAAYDALLQCKRAACVQCFSASTASFDKFNQCEHDAGTTVCESYLKQQTADCTTMGDGGPSDQCIPPGGSSLQAAFDILAPKYCGKPAVDGGK